MNAWPIELALCASGRWTDLAARLGAPHGVQPGAVWIHGASLGECGAARRLAAGFPAALVTADTAAGAQLGRFRPLDHPWTLARLWAEARPRMLVFVESSWWPGLAGLARRHGVPVVSVGARATPRTAVRLRVLGGPDAVQAATEADASWFRARGVPVLAPIGSPKGGPPGPSPLSWPGPFLAVASGREGDEDALRRARDAVAPDLPVLFAPRHRERVPSVRRSLDRPYVERHRSGPQSIPAGHDVLVRTRGELAALLVGARVALIGGTFDPTIGGHSPLEARWAGAVALFGPHTHANTGFVGVRVPDRGALADGLRRALETPPEAPEDPVPPILETLARVAGSPAAETAPRPWLAPLGPLQALGMARRRRVPRRSSPVPVVAVGSRNARGAGKTPTALWIADRLAERGHRVGVLTRGTGRSRWRVGDSEVHGADPDWLGDEGVLFAMRGHRVAAHADRRRAVEALTGCTVWLVEDGLQTFHWEPGLAVETVDCRFPNARGPLPAGEDRGRVQTAHVRVLHHPEGFEGPGFRAVRRPGPWNTEPPGPRFAFAGIGRPADFFDTVEPVHTRVFRDHHRYTRADWAALLAWAGEGSLVSTDRDAARLRFPAELHYRGVCLDVPDFPLERLP